jgi:hypothetical protein
MTGRGSAQLLLPRNAGTGSTRRLETNYVALNRTSEVTRGPVSEQDTGGNIFDAVTPFYTPSSDDLHIVPLYLKGKYCFTQNFKSIFFWY